MNSKVLIHGDSFVYFILENLYREASRAPFFLLEFTKPYDGGRSEKNFSDVILAFEF